MFGFGKKKDKSDKIETIVSSAISLINLQIQMGNSSDNNYFDERISSNFGRGYIFGFCDSITQASGLDAAESFATVHLIYRELFGAAHAESLVNEAIDNQEEREFMNGLSMGGKN